MILLYDFAQKKEPQLKRFEIMTEKRLFIVANRLPVNVDEETGIKPSSGGLATAIKSYLNHTGTEQVFTSTYWIGVPGCSPETWGEASKELPESSYEFMPVFVEPKAYDAYYNEFSNSVLWPLFHYFPSYVEYDMESFEHYMKVNEVFLESLMKEARETDVVWIHDYHLLPLSSMLREAIPGITIGFFLHIPFPSFELMRLLPKNWQTALVGGMLGADLIGFHTVDYATHFLQTVQNVFGLENDLYTIRYNNRLVKVDVFPISIDYAQFNSAYDLPEVEEQRAVLKESFADKKVIFSVDRLDYTKGISNRIKGFEYFLQENPDFHNKVVFVMVIVPSRDNISKYAERKKLIDEAISDMNSRIGNIQWQPVIYQYNSLSFEKMIALYTASDLALITPLRDGMNLVAKEFVASRKDKRGVLVISEMAGAARELTDGLIINPNDIKEIAEKIKEGLEMNEAEQQERMETMQRRIAAYDVVAWAADFLSQLEEVRKKQQEFQVRILDNNIKRRLFDAYRQANHRLILLDYDGTLVPFASHPGDAKPGEHLIDLLRNLSSVEGNEVVIISGRNADWLEQQLGDLSLWMIAEHGAKVKLKDGTWTKEVSRSDEWKQQIDKIMQNYVRRCAHTFVEEKEFTLVWHYRNANPEQGKIRSIELFNELNEHSKSLDLQVLMGNKIVEVRTQGIGKHIAIKKILLNSTYDFIIALGDDRTDEDMFELLADRENCYTIKVGNQASYAKYNLINQQKVIGLLEEISALNAELVG
jgi:trehalose 6-phosphate synthase/phosphatase